MQPAATYPSGRSQSVRGSRARRATRLSWRLSFVTCHSEPSATATKLVHLTRTGIRRCVGKDFALLRCHQRPAAGQRNATAVALRRVCGATQRTTQRRPGELCWTTRTANFSCVPSEPPSLTPPRSSTRHTPTSRTLPANRIPMLLRPSRRLPVFENAHPARRCMSWSSRAVCGALSGDESE